MGLPIVATNIRGCRQVVDDGVYGLLIPVHNISKFETAITKLINAPELRERMGSASYQKDRKEFDEKNLCRIVTETYQKAFSDINIL